MSFILKISMIIVLFSISHTDNKNFKLYKLGNATKGGILIVGGIHGNEPGSYFSASLFQKHYTINSGLVWVIPNLNHDSIIRNARGIYGDMNRKFLNVKKKDRDYKTIVRLKKILLDKKIDLVLNLHDGHGFYRSKYQNRLLNPKAWGQASIIDQDNINIDSMNTDNKFANLRDVAHKVSKIINKNMKNDKHKFGVKNTQTKNKNKSMQKSLTYFVLQNNKSALAIETSKNIKDISLKAQYQLKAIEAYLEIAGISFDRDIDIDNIAEVKKSIYDFGTLKINNRFTIPLSKVRSFLPFIPMSYKNNVFQFSNNLGKIIKKKKLYYVFIGNKHISTFRPTYFKNTKNNHKILVDIDRNNFLVEIGDMIEVNNSFKVISDKFRVNVIGYGTRKDNNHLVTKKKIHSRFSLDKTNKYYRVEIYDKKYFVGSILVKFK